MIKIINLIYKRFLKLLIILNLVRNKTFKVNNKHVKFHRIKENNLLIGISIDGFNSHETEVVNLVKEYSKNWALDYFLDLGSNVGHYAVIACCYMPKIKVIAVEPFPNNVRYLNELKESNGLCFDIIDRAADDSDNEKKIFYYPVSKSSSKLAGTGRLFNSFQGSGGVYDDLPYKTLEVKTISLDTILRDIDNKAFGLIKVDCEGNEMNILKNSSVLSYDNVDFIIEIMIKDSDKDSIFNLMIKKGYTGYLITNAGLLTENRPLTLPRPNNPNRTLWRNHFFTKKTPEQVKAFSETVYGNFL